MTMANIMLRSCQEKNEPNNQISNKVPQERACYISSKKRVPDRILYGEARPRGLELAEVILTRISLRKNVFELDEIYILCQRGHESEKDNRLGLMCLYM
jgi:hypothetical protein